LETVARSLFNPTSKLVDVALVNEEVFLNNLCIGWYVYLVTRRERYEKRVHRRLAKITAVVARLFLTKRLRITLDGQRERVWLVWVVNGAFSNTPLEVPERESLEAKFLIFVCCALGLDSQS
jgi:diacylglycerol kinase family enzyme